MEKYRIKEVKFDNGKSEYYPQVYQKVSHFWYSKMEWVDIGCGFGKNSLEYAKVEIESHKENNNRPKEIDCVYHDCD